MEGQSEESGESCSKGRARCLIVDICICAAELIGRHYGGGVLKLEPSEACQLPVFSGSDPKFLHELDALARQKGRSAARALADDVVLHQCLGLDRADVKALSRGVIVLQAHRRRSPS